MDISVGAVGTAIIAGLVSILGLIIAKEQKVSEFRQAWIEELRKCLISYLANINAISDFVRTKKAGTENDPKDLASFYKALNEASLGITLRVNENEDPAEKLVQTMQNFEALARSNANLTPENIQLLEVEFLKHSKKLLKFEWKRVKRGENVFVWTKWFVGIVTLAMIAWFVYLVFLHPSEHQVRPIGNSISIPKWQLQPSSAFSRM